MVVRKVPTFLVSTDEQREILDQFQRRCLHFSEAYQKNKPLCFNARAFQQMHPEKENEGHEDGDATLASPMLLGVCDGVSQVEELGLDVGALPHELLQRCEEIATTQLLSDGSRTSLKAADAYGGPVSLLKEAYEDTESFGSTSVLLAVMDNSTMIHGKLHPMVGVVTLGDCEMVMLRRQGNKRGPLQVVLHTEMQRIGGHSQTPLQLARMDEEHDPDFDEEDAIDAIERGSGLHCTSAYEGDILILGSDGVFDNLFLNEVVDICNQRLPAIASPFEPSQPSRLAEIAECIVKKAHLKSEMNLFTRLQSTPVGAGGKADDASVVVAEIIEWTAERREVWARKQRRPSVWSSLFSCSAAPCSSRPCCSAPPDATPGGASDSASERFSESGASEQEHEESLGCTIV